MLFCFAIFLQYNCVLAFYNCFMLGYCLTLTVTLTLLQLLYAWLLLYIIYIYIYYLYHNFCLHCVSLDYWRIVCLFIIILHHMQYFLINSFSKCYAHTVFCEGLCAFCWNSTIKTFLLQVWLEKFLNPFLGIILLIIWMTKIYIVIASMVFINMEVVSLSYCMLLKNIYIEWYVWQWWLIWHYLFCFRKNFDQDSHR